MPDSIDIRELMQSVQARAARRQNLEERYFGLPAQHLQQLEAILQQTIWQQVPLLEQELAAIYSAQQQQALLTHASVKETALAGSKNALSRLYKKLLFAVLKPALTHQQAFNEVAAQILQQQQALYARKIAVIKEHLTAVNKYSLELMKDLMRATTLLLEQLLQEEEAARAEIKAAGMAGDDALRAEINAQLLNLQRRLRIGLVHLNNALRSGDAGLEGEVHSLREKDHYLLARAEQSAEQLERLRRRLRIGLVHLNNAIHYQSQKNDAEQVRAQAQYQELSRRLSEFALEISDSLRTLSRGPKDQSAAILTPPAPAEASLYNDPLFFDLQGFEDSVRGVDTTSHFQDYVAFFTGRRQVLDAGCGTGVFLQLLQQGGIGAYGIDLDARAVAACRQKELPAQEAGVIEHLTSLADGSLDGFFAAQLIEHLSFTSLVQMLRLAFRKLQAGSPLLLETVNTTCLTIYSGSFYADPTHLRPVHPVTLKFLLDKIGYQKTELKFIHPFSDTERLQAVTAIVDVPDNAANLLEAVRIVDDNSRKLNEVLFSYKDYAIITYKP